jgi:hypothetical protein
MPSQRNYVEIVANKIRLCISIFVLEKPLAHPTCTMSRFSDTTDSSGGNIIMSGVRAPEEAQSSTRDGFWTDHFVTPRSHAATLQQEIQPRTPATQKELLPRRSGESRLAPPQYVYPASRSGVVPAKCTVDNPSTPAA